MRTKIKQLREQKGMTTEELAQKLGIGTATLYRYENNKTPPPSDVLAKIADLFGVTTDYVLGRESVVTMLSSHESEVINLMRSGETIEAIRVLVGSHG